ncbi:helix-turn-helix transcriptional regulator [Nostoc cf. edaphicum LEGE 07299]|uniref:Helix-turn-helix transcriptional regulator n=1 Tax=Nostoc cf. edaphicum LEGE 07299 TaxID=2777974 RepID=A0ABR9TVC4_9NOSO|nr:helix-turn-helix transcriptional regulator [Nostoc edaphicum]MBE9104030.1 helix-turn-helix transcriptional regulator [Nostoc cf. edaphicum LEGE 07299]
MDEAKPKILTALGYLVRRHRTELGISQEELGLRANLDRTYISGVERGVRNPSLTALVSLAVGLGINVSLLLESLEIEADRIQ